MPDGAQQHVMAERSHQEFDSSGLHGPDRHGQIAVARDENDRHVAPFDDDALLQVTGEVLHVDGDAHASRW